MGIDDNGVSIVEVVKLTTFNYWTLVVKKTEEQATLSTHIGPTPPTSHCGFTAHLGFFRDNSSLGLSTSWKGVHSLVLFRVADPYSFDSHQDPAF
jgi:hypothetical protein